jgi:DNA-binding winged helix-turn-helix (wHTH) protein
MAELFFGDFRLDTKKLTLSGSDSSAVEIRAKALELLLYLIDNRDRFVDRRELLEKVWPGVTVTGASLTQCVSELRHALDDSVNEPRYIETKIKKGYRFVAPIYHKPTERLELLPPPPSLAPPAQAQGKRLSRIAMIVAAVVIAAAVVAAVLWRVAPRPANTVAVAANLARPNEPLSADLVQATTTRVRAAIRSLPHIELVEELEGTPTEAAYQVVLECSSWHDIRMELKATLVESGSGDLVWGWTWVVPHENASIESTASTAAAEVEKALRQHLGER